MEERNLRKERIGLVLSNKMDKTITVAVHFKEKHPIYVSSLKRPKSSPLMMKRMSVISVIP